VSSIAFVAPGPRHQVSPCSWRVTDLRPGDSAGAPQGRPASPAGYGARPGSS
jgi:hypothetical protein